MKLINEGANYARNLKIEQVNMTFYYKASHLSKVISGLYLSAHYNRLLLYLI